MLDDDWIRSASKSYDRVAEPYAEMVREGLDDHPLERSLVTHFARDAGAGGHPVLDAGCGPGVLSRDLATHGLDVVGVDASPGMLGLARGTARSARFAAASITRLPFADGTFGGVLCWYVLHHVPDADLLPCLRELARVTRPGGALLIGGHVGDDSAYVKTSGYGGLPMRVWFVRRTAAAYADLLREAGLEVEATVELGPERPATGAVWLARRPREDGPAEDARAPKPPPAAKVVTLCGSTRFATEFAELNQRLTLEGCVVLSPGMFSLPDLPGYDWDADPDDVRGRLAGVHRQKIRLADEVWVVDPGGYVGESTRSEIAYAESLGTPVRYLSDD